MLMKFFAYLIALCIGLAYLAMLGTIIFVIFAIAGLGLGVGLNAAGQ